MIKVDDLKVPMCREEHPVRLRITVPDLYASAVLIIKSNTNRNWAAGGFDQYRKQCEMGLQHEVIDEPVYKPSEPKHHHN